MISRSLPFVSFLSVLIFSVGILAGAALAQSTPKTLKALYCQNNEDGKAMLAYHSEGDPDYLTFSFYMISPENETCAVSEGFARRIEQGKWIYETGEGTLQSPACALAIEEEHAEVTVAQARHNILPRRTQSCKHLCTGENLLLSGVTFDNTDFHDGPTRWDVGVRNMATLCDQEPPSRF